VCSEEALGSVLGIVMVYEAHRGLPAPKV